MHYASLHHSPSPSLPFSLSLTKPLARAQSTIHVIGNTIFDDSEHASMKMERGVRG